ncbi:MAG: hypothetical protein ACK5Y2_00270 [Bdellovibrionales bacterium]
MRNGLLAVLVSLSSQVAWAQGADVKEPGSPGESILKTKKIQHPGAKDGLYLIDEEKVYHYRVETKSKQDYSFQVRLASQSTPEIETEINGATYGYEDFYGSSNLTGVDFLYEWKPWKSFGQAGFQLGGGILLASGNGRFARDTLIATPKEDFTLFSIPLSAGIVYRFQYVDRQWFVPYLAGGGIYNGLIEYREDGDTKIVGSPAAYGSGGGMINLTALSRNLAFAMDREYGFSNLWLTAEFRLIQSFNEDLDVSSNQISVGLGADY